MKFFKRLWQKIIHPSVLQGIIAFVCCAAFIAAAVVVSLKYGVKVGACALYVLAFLSLVYGIYLIVKCAPTIKKRALVLAQKTKFTKNFTGDYAFRTVVLAVGSFVLSCLYVIYNLAIAAYYSSVWYYIMSGYYFSLLVARGLVIWSSKKGENSDAESEEKRIKGTKNYIACGIWLILFSGVVIGNIVQLTRRGESQTRSFHLIYVFAVYTAIRIVLVVRNIIRANKGDNLVTRSLRTISFADGMVSLLSLQTALLQAFSSDWEAEYGELWSAATGGVIISAVMVAGLIMVIRGAKLLKKEKSDVREGVAAKEEAEENG